MIVMWTSHDGQCGRHIMVMRTSHDGQCGELCKSHGDTPQCHMTVMWLSCERCNESLMIGSHDPDSVTVNI